MYRHFLIVVVLVSPAFAQYGGESLLNRPRQFDGPISTGLVLPALPDEALIDREAWLREPIPTEEVTRLRAGFRRPAQGTVWREPITLPSEESLRQQERVLRDTLQRMQGVWRSQSLMVDGQVLPSGSFGGLHYLITDTLVEQSATANPMLRSKLPNTPSLLQAAVNVGQRLGVSTVAMDGALRTTPEPSEYWAGPTATSRQAGTVMHNDPFEKEAVRLSAVFRGSGQALVYSWDRYGESVDPHNALNRPSQRVVLPSLGAMEASVDRMVLAVRDIGARGFLPEHLRGPLGTERTVFIRVGRSEQISNSNNPVPVVGPPTGDMSMVLGLGRRASQQQAQVPAMTAVASIRRGTQVVRPPTHIVLVPQRKPAPSPKPEIAQSKPRKNIIPTMHRVELAPPTN